MHQQQLNCEAVPSYVQASGFLGSDACCVYTVPVTQVAKAEQDRVMLERVTHDNAVRLQQKAVAAEQARLEERR